MRRARVVATSDSADTYVDVLAAIAASDTVDEIEFIFFDSEVKRELLSDVQKKLVDLRNLEPYELASRLKISGKAFAYDLSLLLKDCRLLDVTGVPKEQAVEIAANALQGTRIKVCNLRWLERLDRRRRFRIGQDQYSYSDLLSTSAVRALRKDFVAKKHVIAAFGVIIAATAVFAIAQLLFGWSAPDKLVSILSLLVGIGGLQLAYVSLRRPYA